MGIKNASVVRHADIFKSNVYNDRYTLFLTVNVNLKAQLILPRIENSNQLNEIKLLFIEKNYIRRFEN